MRTDYLEFSTGSKGPLSKKRTLVCENAFKTLTTAPVLGFSDSKKSYIVHTDASTHGLSAALHQEQAGRLGVIAYASRGLSNCERRTLHMSSNFFL